MPGERVLKALCNLRVNEDFKTVVKWLAANRDDAVEVFPELKEIDLIQFQGYAKTLLTFLDIVETAPEVLDKSFTKNKVKDFP
jgi:hypothetical protein